MTSNLRTLTTCCSLRIYIIVRDGVKVGKALCALEHWKLEKWISGGGQCGPLFYCSVNSSLTHWDESKGAWPKLSHEEQVQSSEPNLLGAKGIAQSARNSEQ